MSVVKTKLSFIEDGLTIPVEVTTSPSEPLNVVVEDVNTVVDTNITNPSIAITSATTLDVNLVSTAVTQPVEQVIGDEFDVLITNPAPIDVNCKQEVGDVLNTNISSQSADLGVIVNNSNINTIITDVDITSPQTASLGVRVDNTSPIDVNVASQDADLGVQVNNAGNIGVQVNNATPIDVNIDNNVLDVNITNQAADLGVIVNNTTPIDVKVDNTPLQVEYPGGFANVNILSQSVDVNTIVANPAPIDVNVDNAQLDVNIAAQDNDLGVQVNNTNPILTEVEKINDTLYEIAVGNSTTFENRRISLRKDNVGGARGTICPSVNNVVLTLIPSGGVTLAISSDFANADFDLIVQYYATPASTTFSTLSVRVNGQTKINTGVSIFRIRDFFIDPATLAPTIPLNALVYFYDNIFPPIAGVPVVYFDIMAVVDGSKRSGVLYCPPGRQCLVPTIHANTDINSVNDVLLVEIEQQFNNSFVTYNERFYISGSGYTFTDLLSSGQGGSTFSYLASQVNGTGVDNIILSVELMEYTP